MYIRYYLFYWNVCKRMDTHLTRLDRSVLFPIYLNAVGAGIRERNQLFMVFLHRVTQCLVLFVQLFHECVMGSRIQQLGCYQRILRCIGHMDNRSVITGCNLNGCMQFGRCCPTNHDRCMQSCFSHLIRHMHHLLQ